MKNLINRPGSKSRLVEEIIQHFPPHDVYIEPFFGTGSIYFAKTPAKINYLNDIDDEVCNFWRQVVDNPEKLVSALKKTIITETQFKKWGRGENEKSDVMRAIRFFTLSNYGFNGTAHTLATDKKAPDDYIKEKIKDFDFFHEKLQKALIFNRNYEKFLDVIIKRHWKNAFCYCDPPYVGTNARIYRGFTSEDFCNLLDVLMAKNIKFAVSEFDSDFVVREAKKRKLNVVRIKERQNIQNRRTEILIMNYETKNILFEN